jgi:RNA polymerase-binding transcription factor DksA
VNLIRLSQFDRDEGRLFMRTSKQILVEKSRAESNCKTHNSTRHAASNAYRLLKQRRRLLKLREKLLSEIQDQTAEAREDIPSYSMHPADAATDSFARDLVLGLVSFEQLGIYEIDAALKRIENGTYGVCEMTGQRIPLLRLEAIPWTRFTLEAEMEAEKQVNGNSHPRLGTLRTLQPFEEEPVEEVLADAPEVDSF